MNFSLLKQVLSHMAILLCFRYARQFQTVSEIVQRERTGAIRQSKHVNQH